MSEYEVWSQIYIKEATIDYVNELIHLTISNPTDYNSVATRLVVLSGSMSYSDESEDATGFIYSNTETKLTWNPEEALAPTGFLAYDEVYLVMMTTVTKYTCLHQILPVRVTIRVDEWNFKNDRVFLEAEWKYSIYLNISRIGLRKIGSDDECYYNVSDCLVDEWYKGDLYYWTEFAASAPSGFLSKGDAYLALIIFSTPSERAQYTGPIRYFGQGNTL